MPGGFHEGESAAKAPREAGRCVPQALLWRKVGRDPEGPQIGGKIGFKEHKTAGGGPVADPVPDFLEKAPIEGRGDGDCGAGGTQYVRRKHSKGCALSNSRTDIRNDRRKVRQPAAPYFARRGAAGPTEGKTAGKPQAAKVTGKGAQPLDSVIGRASNLPGWGGWQDRRLAPIWACGFEGKSDGG
jgi:hypothetical protein